MRALQTGAILAFSIGCLEEILSAKRCNVAVLASGTGSNFRAIAEASSRGEIPARVMCLISDNSDAPAIELARSLGIPVEIIVPPTAKAGLPAETENAIVSVCKAHEIDLIALAGYMRILKGPLLDAYDGRIMNIHPSLLPSFKGLHAVRQALDYGVKVTGCTVHFVDRTIDGGAIIAQSAIPIGEDDSEETLLAKMHAEEHRLYVQAVALFAVGRLQRENRRTRIVDDIPQKDQQRTEQ